MTATPTIRERHAARTAHAVEMAVRRAWGIARDNRGSLDSERLTAALSDAVGHAVADVTEQLTEAIRERDKAIADRKTLKRELAAVKKERDNLVQKAAHGCTDAWCEECDA